MQSSELTKTVAALLRDHDGPMVLPGAEIYSLRRGVVLLRGAFDPTQLEAAVDDAFARGERRTPHGAVQTGWYADATSKQLNYGTQRGRVYDRVETYGSNLVKLGANALFLAQTADIELPIGLDKVATHTLLVRYDEGSRGIAGHVDDAVIDGDNDAPIVSFNFGNTARFLYADTPWDRYKGVSMKDHGVREVEMQHGDCIVWGGPARYLWHGIDKIQSGTMPAATRARLGLDEKGTRINATFRCTPELVGREAEFQTVVKNMTPAQKRAAKRAREANAAAYA